MAQNNWIATGIGSFTAAAGWSLGPVPTSSEDAFIGTMGAIVASTINETVNSIGTGTSGDVLLINSGSTFTGRTEQVPMQTLAPSRSLMVLL